MHGYVPKEKVKRGKAHGMYKEGSRTQEAQKQLSEQNLRLALLEDLAFLLGLCAGNRSRGPKPKFYKKLTSLDEIKKAIG
jgi:hypothetical protein